MKKEEAIKLAVWSYQEGYKAAMSVISTIANDRSQDEIISKKMEELLKSK
jgi:hypothetical protein